MVPGTLEGNFSDDHPVRNSVQQEELDIKEEEEEGEEKCR